MTTGDQNLEDVARGRAGIRGGRVEREWNHNAGRGQSNVLQIAQKNCYETVNIWYQHAKAPRRALGDEEIQLTFFIGGMMCTNLITRLNFPSSKNNKEICVSTCWHETPMYKMFPSRALVRWQTFFVDCLTLNLINFQIFKAENATNIGDYFLNDHGVEPDLLNRSSNLCYNT